LFTIEGPAAASDGPVVIDKVRLQKGLQWPILCKPKQINSKTNFLLYE